MGVTAAAEPAAISAAASLTTAVAATLGSVRFADGGAAEAEGEEDAAENLHLSI